MTDGRPTYPNDDADEGWPLRESSAEADSALRQAEIAFTEVANSPSAVRGALAVPYHRDVERIWAAMLPFLSRPATPPLDVEGIADEVRAMASGTGEYRRGFANGITALQAALPATPPLDVETREDGIERLQWLVWFARKYKGTARDVAGKAWDQNPELRALAPTPEPSAEADAAHPDWRDATPEQWDAARDALSDPAHFDAMLIARYPLQRDNYVAYIVAKAASEPSAEADAGLVEAFDAVAKVIEPLAIRGLDAPWGELRTAIARTEPSAAAPSDPEVPAMYSMTPMVPVFLNSGGVLADGTTNTEPIDFTKAPIESAAAPSDGLREAAQEVVDFWETENEVLPLHIKDLRAALATEQREGLDVERLARALAVCNVWRQDKAESLLDLATSIVAEYAALREAGA